MLGTLTLACNTCNPSLKCSRIIGNKVQTRIGCVRGRWVATVFDGFRRFSTVFDGFQLFSIVFNGLSLHEVNTQGVMWSVIGEVFFFFCLIFFFCYVFFFFVFYFFFFLFFFFFCSPQTNYWFAWGFWGFASLPQQCEGH